MSIRVKTRADGHKAITASAYGGGGFGSITSGTSASGSSQSVSRLLGADVKASMLSGIIDEDERGGERSMQAVYRDIYHHDHLAGAAVDLKAALPWSDFSLTGRPDDETEVFLENIERLNLKDLNFEMSVDYMVTGAFVGLLVYDERVTDRGFSDIMTFDYGDCELMQVPLYSRDPIITLNISDEMRKFAASPAPDAEAAKASMPPSMVAAMQESKVVDLDSLATVYMPRSTMSSMQAGVSLYRRVLPIWLYERILYRGTLTDATRRQKSTMHIKVGDENWIPTDDELNQFLKLFQETEKDPISSFVATVHGVDTEEILPPGNDLRWTDMSQSMTEMKLMALGASIGFLQGEASASTQDVAISTFIEMVETYRRFATDRLYYNKLFPLIAHMNGFRDEGAAKETSASGTRDVVRLQQLQIDLNETRSLAWPKIQWHKTLRPSANRDYLDTLVLLEEKGVPLPLRMWASVGGLDFEQLTKDLEKDKADRELVKKLKPPPPPDPDGGFGGGGGRGFASVEEGAPRREKADRPTAETAALSRLVNRPYAESDMELFGLTRTGRRKWLVDQHRQARDAHGRMEDALRRLSDPDHYEKVRRQARSGRR